MDYGMMHFDAINIAVGESFGWTAYFIHQDGSITFRDDKGRIKGKKNYCHSASDAWPIMHREGIGVGFDEHEQEWTAFQALRNGKINQQAATHSSTNPLLAAMIVYLQLQEAK
ncbi:phage protein NinX family protein [Pseudescherichia sp.]|uniref:phage protein NinX family protein n=1 Tax=Pseudescherichia sp. TaxID=2055881 RepID=UPI00289CB6BF|nr:phage protein NinX family protein [Pseudescherichia sp.]